MMIPGIHRYHVTYAQTDRQRFDASIASNLDVLGASNDEYRDLHDTDTAFVDSYAGYLDQQFHYPNKKFDATYEKGGRKTR